MEVKSEEVLVQVEQNHGGVNGELEIAIQGLCIDRDLLACYRQLRQVVQGMQAAPRTETPYLEFPHIQILELSGPSYPRLLRSAT